MLATVASAAAMLVAPLPASAAGPHLCETYGSYCLGSANLNLGTTVYETTPGRNLLQTSLGGTFDNHPTYELQFSADLSKCVASANDYDTVVIRACNDFGTVWARIKDDTNVYRWINRYATQHNSFGDTLYLSGYDTGTTFEVRPLGQYGRLYKFGWQS
jgi:hypothetical protein